jgi:hypothetical protein
MIFKSLSSVLAVLLIISSAAFAQDIEEEIIEEELLEEEFLEEEDVNATETNIGDTVVNKEPKKVTTEISGNIRGDYRYFPKESLYPGQKKEYFSAIFNPELYVEWDKGKQRLQFKGFARLNQYDNHQSHWDIREFYYQKVFKKWEVSLGAKQIYWGFTESNHLANVINQDDVLEGSDVKNKLGQPMLHISNTRKWGTIDFMVMTYFRQMEFPGPNGRLRPPFEIDNSKTTFESNAKEYNPDVAFRWSHTIKSIDLAVSNFYGTSRTPLISSINGVTFTQSYELINQTGLELQATTGAMLWKIEAINRISERKTIKAATLGGEYTFSNVFKSDVGILVEYTYDDRGIESINGLDDDFFIGMRIAFNDKQSSDFLGGVNVDRKKGTTTYFAEANRRLGDSWRITLKTLWFSNINETDFIYLLRNDGYVEFSLAKYF